MWWWSCFLGLISVILNCRIVSNQFHLQLFSHRHSLTIKNSRRCCCSRNCELFVVKWWKIKALQFASFQNDFVKTRMHFKSCSNFCLKHNIVLRLCSLSYFQQNHLIQRLMALVRQTLDKRAGVMILLQWNKRSIHY